MSNKYGYTQEKMFNALTTLTEHPGVIQERILAAMMSASTVIDPYKFDKAFPPNAREHAREIHERMTALGSFAASVCAMSDEEAVQVAERMRELYFRIHVASGANEGMGGELDRG